MEQDRPQDQPGTPPESSGSPPEPTGAPEPAAPTPPASPADAAPPATDSQQPAAPAAPPASPASSGSDASPAAPPTAPWSAPPAPPQGQAPMAWAPEAPAHAGVFVRSGEVAAAAWVLVILGILGLLFGALTVLVGSFLNRGSELVTQDPEFDQILPIFGAFAGVIAVIGVILIIYSLGYIAAGWGGYRGRSWARVLGIVIAVIGILVWLPGIASAGDAGGSIVLTLIVLACHAWILFAYAARWRRA
jgi:hypothetical protein